MAQNNMGPFERLKEKVDYQKKHGCQDSSELDQFIEDYGNQIATAAQALKKHQAKERAH